MRSRLVRLDLGAAVMAVALAAACGNPESALRAEGQVRSSTIVPTSTTQGQRLTTVVPAPSSTTAPVSAVTTSTTTPAVVDSR